MVDQLVHKGTLTTRDDAMRKIIHNPFAAITGGTAEVAETLRVFEIQELRTETTTGGKTPEVALPEGWTQLDTDRGENEVAVFEPLTSNKISGDNDSVSLDNRNSPDIQIGTRESAEGAHEPEVKGAILSGTVSGTETTTGGQIPEMNQGKSVPKAAGAITPTYKHYSTRRRPGRRIPNYTSGGRR